jgi:uncharacterized membrane protein
VFCGNCGARQREAPPGTGSGASAGSTASAFSSGARTDFATGITPRTASLLCYIPVVGWIGSIIVLASTRFREDRVTRFHAWQGLYLFVAWLIVEWVLEPFFGHIPGRVPFVGVFKLAIIIAWIVMLVKTSQEQVFHLPIIGDLAERSVAEQR